MSQRLGKHLAGWVFVHPRLGEIEVFRHSWSG
jgi:hypothetical protein